MSISTMTTSTTLISPIWSRSHLRSNRRLRRQFAAQFVEVGLRNITSTTASWPRTVLTSSTLGRSFRATKQKISPKTSVRLLSRLSRGARRRSRWCWETLQLPTMNFSRNSKHAKSTSIPSLISAVCGPTGNFAVKWGSSAISSSGNMPCSIYSTAESPTMPATSNTAWSFEMLCETLALSGTLRIIDHAIIKFLVLFCKEAIICQPKSYFLGDLIMC